MIKDIRPLKNTASSRARQSPIGYHFEEKLQTRSSYSVEIVYVVRIERFEMLRWNKVTPVVCTCMIRYLMMYGYFSGRPTTRPTRNNISQGTTRDLSVAMAGDNKPETCRVISVSSGLVCSLKCLFNVL